MAEAREIPPGAVEEASAASRRGAEKWSEILEAALSFLASSPEGRAWLVRQVFSDEDLKVLERGANLCGYFTLADRIHAALELRGDGNDG